ncbi:MAG: multiheme c-type cytochrome [bacterium]
MNKKYLIILCCFYLLSCSQYKETTSDVFTSKAIVSEETQECLACHTKKNPSIVDSWQKSSHAESGIGCFECHEAQSGDPDELEHYNERLISVIVSPQDCGNCHETEAEQFLNSTHAKAGEISGSPDKYLGETVQGIAAYILGCQQCHGSIVEVNDGELSSETWPNFGIGRINPDGTSGACSACHSRHDFSRAQARTPETCSRCHLGPDHPQKEVYEESKHAIRYRSHQSEMNFGSPTWVVGIDYSAAPVCATCHVAATLNQSSTHDIGFRLSWNNRAEVSFKMEKWERKRGAMKDVCHSCHNPNYVYNFYKQYDAGVELYNNKFAQSAKEIIKKLAHAKVIDPVPFNQEIEWTYYYLWHIDGREARNGLAMMGPAYVQLHGLNDYVKRFYTTLIPQAERLLSGVTKEIMEGAEHRWFKGEMTQ